ncbi:uncharacterized protein LOC115452977 [Manduca sexta]|uniref:uncharacterized protein LOC115452977 n=1 Tax=Manduca sexta TaxID=7130 RepID=UPI00188EECFE|nr:uncharacterized protein LOC115452977 [Manduca sexta]
MANIFYGCTATQIRKVAFDYAESMNLKHNFNKVTKMAGRDWLTAFMARNNISVRKPEATSINRITAFNKEEVQLFFKLLEEIMEKHKFLPKNIYNCDETGMTTVQTPGKILATKGQKRVGSITSWERGKNITLMFAMSAAGGFIPPMFIYPRKRMTPLLEKDGPSGALYKCSDNGWINESLFLEWLTHFKNHAKPSVDEPVLLILDNHASHSSLPIYEFCKSNYIHMLSLPPHTSHRMQPLDVSFFGPLKTAYKKECDLHIKSHRLEHISPYDVASLVRKAYITVASINKAESGFRATGIFPINPQVFCEEDFMAAEILQSDSIVVCNESITISTCDIEQDSNVIPSTSKLLDLSAVSESAQVVISSPTSQDKESSDPTSNVQFSDFIKLPEKTTVAKEKQRRKKQHATVLTSTPLKKDLIEKENKKITKIQKEQEKEKKKWKGKGQGKKTKVQKGDGPQRAKRQVLQDLNDTSVSDTNNNDLCQDDENDDAEDAGNRCLICCEFGRNNEMWYRCTTCGLWAHAECTGWDSAEGYVCDMC